MPVLGIFFDAVVEDAKGWVEAQKEQTVLELGERAGKLSGSLVSTLILVTFIGIAFLMVSLALGLWLGQVLGNMVHGFLVVGGIYLLMALLFALFGSRIVRELTMLHVINATRNEEESIQ